MTAAQGCLFGNHLSRSAGNEGLKATYGVFQQAAHALDLDYRPKTTKRQFSQRLRQFLEWVKLRALPEPIKQRLLRLRGKSHLFQRAYDFPGTYRTSNQVDRPMNYLDRILYAMQGFHGNWQSEQKEVRAMALLWNCHPFCRKTRAQKEGCLCPFEQLNGFRYHDDWMRNFLIASSLNGRRPLTKSTHTN